MRSLSSQETALIHGGFFETFLIEQSASIIDSALKMIILIVALGGLGYGVYGLLT